MAPPPPKPCYVGGCDYITTAGIPTYDMLMRDLEMHIRCVHTDVHQQGAAPQAAGPKPDRLPRPTIGEGVTESDWMHFSDKWSRYKRSTLTGASPQHVSDQLWACCDTELEVSVYNTGVNSDSDEATLLSAMRKLAVRAQNTLVNVVKFLDMAQDGSDETAGAFTARLKGQASTCNFLIKCSSSTCNQDTNYSDQMVCHQLVRGLADPTIQEQMLAHGADNADLDLATTLKFVEAKEAGKRSSNLLTTAGGLNKMSEFQKKKFDNKVNDRFHAADNRKCGWCGLTGHGGRASAGVRKEKCKAFKHSCETCSAVGHFGSMCRTKKKTKQNQ